MSFNTRSGRSIGRGLGMSQTQVTYHQVPQRQPFVQAQQPQHHQHQQQQQSPVSQQTQQLQQQQQQQQQQQSPQQPQLQQQQQFKMSQQMTPQQQQQQPPQQSPHINVITKSDPGTPLKQGPVKGEIVSATQPEEAALTGDAAEGATKPWKKHKSATFKVNKVLKRRRQNARFRKLLIPKNAIMVLNELQPGIVFEAEEQTNAFNQATYVVKLEIEGQVYTGDGPSKGSAKAAAAEAAVKGLILKKIAESNLKKETETDDQPLQSTPMDTAGSGDDASDKGSVNGKRVIPEDEVPWGSLASFALFKLFADWKAQGSSIPPVASPVPAGKPFVKPVVPKLPMQPQNKPSMPDNPEALHPVTLVGRIHPGTIFSELSREGNPPTMTFTMGVTINGQQYTGMAKSKKEAKKICAINALKALGVPYNTNV